MTVKGVIKKGLKIAGRTVLGVIIFVYLVVALVNTTPVQSFLASKAAEYFSKEWKTQVHIGALSVTPFINAGIKDICVKDLEGRILLKSSYIEAQLAKIPSSDGVEVGKVKMYDTKCNLIEQNGKFNFQFIIDYFASDKEKEKKESKPFCLRVNDIDIRNIDFSLIDKDKTDTVFKGMFAPSAIVFSDVSMRVEDFVMKGIEMSAVIKDLKAKERCGIELKRFASKVKFSDKGIVLQDAVLQTQDSYLDFDGSMATQSFKTYSSFIDPFYCT